MTPTLHRFAGRCPPRGLICLGAARRQIAQEGFAYLWVMVVLAIMGVYLAQVGTVASTQAQREREAELLRVGMAYQNAIRAYYQDGTTPQERYPATLADLLKDPRVPQSRRYLRKLYVDPLTQSDQWGLVRNQQQRIVGVYSLAPGVPMRQGEFSDEFPGFAGQPAYRGWVFRYQPDVGLGGGRR